MTPGTVVLCYMDTVFLEVNIDGYLSEGVEDFFFVLLFLNLLEPFLGHIFLEGDGY